jgi:hypothetical protein
MSAIRLVTTPDNRNPNEWDFQLDGHRFARTGFNRADQADQDDAVAQRIRRRLQFFKAEWYQDQRIGTPWQQVVFRVGSSDNLIRGIFRRVIQGTPGVADVTSLTWRREVSEAKGYLTFSATTDQGSVLSIKDFEVPFIVTEDPAERT